MKLQIKGKKITGPKFDNNNKVIAHSIVGTALEFAKATSFRKKISQKSLNLLNHQKQESISTKKQPKVNYIAIDDNELERLCLETKERVKSNHQKVLKC